MNIPPYIKDLPLTSYHYEARDGNIKEREYNNSGYLINESYILFPPTIGYCLDNRVISSEIRHYWEGGFFRLVLDQCIDNNCVGIAVKDPTQRRQWLSWKQVRIIGFARRL